MKFAINFPIFDSKLNIVKYFELYSQPIINLENNKIANLELLTRFYNENDELINNFDIFENKYNESYLKKLDLEIIGKSLEKLEKISQYWEYKYFFVAINVSHISVYKYRDFHKKVCDMIERCSNITRENICFEINENSYHNLGEFINLFSKSDFNISIDDMGTKNFSISKLKEEIIPNVENKSKLKIKIDKSFIENINNFDNFETEIDKSYINTIISVKNAYPEVKIIAEGVENEEILNYLSKLNIDYYQGYLWNGPSKFNENYKQP